MKKIILILFLSLAVVSCKVSQKTPSTIKKEDTRILKNTYKNKGESNQKSELIIPDHNEPEVVFSETANENIDFKILSIIEFAKTFHGTPYRFGGTTNKGMDCSGLVYTAFKEENIALPRSSHEIATHGTKINLGEVAKGDLLFFKTNRSRRINHVGIVVDVYPGKVLFIHASTSQGVIISALDEMYWNNAFTEARRII